MYRVRMNARFLKTSFFLIVLLKLLSLSVLTEILPSSTMHGSSPGTSLLQEFFLGMTVTVRLSIPVDTWTLLRMILDRFGSICFLSSALHGCGRGVSTISVTDRDAYPACRFLIVACRVPQLMLTPYAIIKSRPRIMSLTNESQTK